MSSIVINLLVLVHCSHHFLFLESMISLSSQNWSKIKKPVSQSVQWPERRCAHAASHITGTVFVMIGGSGSVSTLSDVWLCDTNQWNKVLSPFTHEFSSNHRL